jgi:hypothetical protein
VNCGKTDAMITATASCIIYLIAIESEIIYVSIEAQKIDRNLGL